MKTLKSLFILFVSLVLFAAVQGQCHGGLTFLDYADLTSNDDGCFDCGETISPTVFCYESNATLQTGMVRMTLTDTMGNGLYPVSWISSTGSRTTVDTINGRVYISTIPHKIEPRPTLPGAPQVVPFLSVTYQTNCNYQGDYIAHARFASFENWFTDPVVCWYDSSWRVNACGTVMGLVTPGPVWMPSLLRKDIAILNGVTFVSSNNDFRVYNTSGQVVRSGTGPDAFSLPSGAYFYQTETGTISFSSQ